MKIFKYIVMGLMLSAAPVSAQHLAGSELHIDNRAITIGDNGQVMIAMDVTIPAEMNLTTNRVAVLTPVLKGEENNRLLPEIWIYGRNRYVVHQRGNDLPENAYTIVRRDNGTNQIVNYSTRLDYEPWMNKAELELSAEVRGCTDCVKESDLAVITRANLVRYEVQPLIAFKTPDVEAVKNRSEQGRAYLDFPVNQTKIYPDYRRNPQELEAIKRTVDVVKNDPNTTITHIDIKGFASPEGTYKGNARLAEGRAKALKEYVKKEYGFEDNLFGVTFEPEDWEGLRNYVADAKNNVPRREEVLAIIDTKNEDYDAKEMRIRKLDNGTIYAPLLKDVYPGLRHSDYVVNYVVRGFDVEEAKRIIKERPQQLSLKEMFQVAQTYPKGSEDFNHVFDVAVRMFPEDPTANTNAAAIELEQRNLQGAELFLAKADPECGVTLNNYGVLKMLQGDLDAAEGYFKRAKEKGITEAEGNLQEVDKKRKDNAVFGK